MLRPNQPAVHAHQNTKTRFAKNEIINISIESLFYSVGGLSSLGGAGSWYTLDTASCRLSDSPVGSLVTLAKACMK